MRCRRRTSPCTTAGAAASCVAASIISLLAAAAVADGAEAAHAGTAIWDFVVVGAGTGGSICAARLAEEGSSVLLLEAGPWDPPWLYEPNGRPRDVEENIWAYPAEMPQSLHINNSPDFHRKLIAGKLLGGTSQVHGDVYNRPPLNEFAHRGIASWNGETLSAAYDRIEADMKLSWKGESELDLPDPQYWVVEKLKSGLSIPWVSNALQGHAVAGISGGWWYFRDCEPNSSVGDHIATTRCMRRPSYWSRVASRNSSVTTAIGQITVLPDSLAVRVLIERQEAIGVEVLRHQRHHAVFARRAVVLAAGVVGTPKVLTLSGVGDPLELQRLGVPVKFANREVGQGLSDHFGTHTWFLLRGLNLTEMVDDPACEDRERFHGFFNLTGPQDGDGMIDAEIRVHTGCNTTRNTVDFFIEAVLLHPDSRGRVVVSSSNPEVLPRIEFPRLWPQDYRRLQDVIRKVGHSLGLVDDDMSATHGLSLSESVAQNSFLYQHFCCSARVAPEGELGVCDEDLHVRGVGGLFIADAAALPFLPSAHTSAPVLALAELAASSALHARRGGLPAHAEEDAGTKEALFAPAGVHTHSNAVPAVPVVRLPSHGAAGDAATSAVELPLLGLGTGTMPRQRVSGAVAEFLRLGGRHLDTAEMYDNYAEVRAGIEASGLANRPDLVVTGKVMPLGREHVRSAVHDALAGLGLDRIDVFLLHWPGDIASGKLMHGRPPPPCVEQGQWLGEKSGPSWRRCRNESYAALLEEQATGRVRAVGVSNFALRHIDQLEEDGLPPLAAHQLELHPLWRDDGLLARHRRDGAQVMAYGCLGGAHTGASLLRQEGFKKIAARRGITAAQVLLRWAVQSGAAVIAGGSSAEHLKENINIFRFELDQEEMDFMSSMAPEFMTKMYGPMPTEIL